MKKAIGRIKQSGEEARDARYQLSKDATTEIE
jgi:hypothetical protein